MHGDTLHAALAEITDLFNRRQTALDPWTSDHYDYDDGYTSGLAQAIAIIEAHMNAQPIAGHAAKRPPRPFRTQRHDPQPILPERNTVQPDTDRIRHDIHELREQTITLDALATRRIKIRRSPTHTRMSSAPTPLNLPAADLLDQIHALARRLATAAGLRYGRSMDAHDLLKGLDRPEPCAALAARDDAWDIIRLITDAVWHTRQLTEPDPSHRYIGICPRCGTGAWIPETQTTGDYRCHECGHLEPIGHIAQAHELRLLTSGTVGTAADLCRLLNACGITIKRNTITQWRKRKRLTPFGQDERGHPVYALADILLLRRAVDRSDCHR